MKQILFLTLLAMHLGAADTNALTIAKAIPSKNVRGRIDHMAVEAMPSASVNVCI